jgi:predicted ester cyclase
MSRGLKTWLLSVLVSIVAASCGQGTGGSHQTHSPDPKPMTPQSSLEIVNRMIEEIQNEKRLDMVDELFSETFINHTPASNTPGNRDGMRQVFAMMHKAFPDGRITVDDQISDGRKVWTRKSFRGTHTGGDFGSVAPSGKVITYQIIDVLAVEDGKITAHWSVLDRLDLYRQLGLIK